eukprot:GHVS01088280.1.p1 GENE.GHVS01088280.1~~GHVS01088280.1.p1  ORF type:complete len:703 (+),score=117.30 GHVS01088280.1:113-2221(+)
MSSAKLSLSRSCSSVSTTASPNNKRTNEQTKQTTNENTKDENLVVNSDKSKKKLKPTTTTTPKQEGGGGEDIGDFSLYRISALSVKSLTDRSIHSLFPIQYKTFDFVYDGQDVIGRAKTGTGKTLSFALPVVERLFASSSRKSKTCRVGSQVLCLTPTRELAQQVNKEFDFLSAGRFASTCLYGGTPDYSQISDLRRGTEVIVGTPGRTLDLLKRGELKTENLSVFILDEADQMLEMGFREDIDAILEIIAGSCRAKSTIIANSDDEQPTTTKQTKAAPKPAMQYLLFTATLPSWVQTIANRFMKANRKTVDVVSTSSSSDSLGAVTHYVVYCGFLERAKCLGDVLMLYGGGPTGKAIVFTETKSQANDIGMSSAISQQCRVLHGDIPQSTREVTLKAFKQGKFNCLVATDVAARGIHVDDVDLVVQIDLPKDVDSYIHRSGRTGRANKSGTCMTFCKHSDRAFLRTIERKANITFVRVGVPQPDELVEALAAHAAGKLQSANVPVDSIASLATVANGLIEQYGAAEAVSRCLYELSGVGRSGCGVLRSALTGREGFKTYSLTFQNANVERHAYAWKALKNMFKDEDLIENCTSMALLEDNKGVVFDVQPEVLPKFEKIAKSLPPQKSCVLEVVRKLPALLVNEDEDNSGGGGDKNPNHKWSSKRTGGGYNNRGNSSSGGGRGGGRGYSKGLRGGRGRGRGY